MPDVFIGWAGRQRSVVSRFFASWGMLIGAMREGHCAAILAL